MARHLLPPGVDGRSDEMIRRLGPAGQAGWRPALHDVGLDPSNNTTRSPGSSPTTTENTLVSSARSGQNGTPMKILRVGSWWRAIALRLALVESVRPQPLKLTR